jgi:hypothetical protein
MNRIPYKIFENFSNIKEKECVEADKHNESLYKNTVKKISGAIMIINKTGISMNIEVPKPPSPNNYQKYVLYKKRNVRKNVIYQSKAVSYLIKKNYHLDVDFEAYQAIDVANWVKKLNGEHDYFLSGNEIDEQNENINTSNIFRQFNNIGVSQESPIISRRNTMRIERRPNSFLKNESRPRSSSFPGGDSIPPLYPSLSNICENNNFNSVENITSPTAPTAPTAPLPQENNNVAESS